MLCGDRTAIMAVRAMTFRFHRVGLEIQVSQDGVDDA